MFDFFDISMSENYTYWWENDVSERDKEDVLSSIETCKSLSNLTERLYEVSGDFNDSPFKKDIEYYEQLLNILQNEADNEVSWNNASKERIPDILKPHIKNLYIKHQKESGDDDIIIA